MHDLNCDFESVTPEIWVANEEGWREKLLTLPNWYQIPLINCNASHNLSDSKLVRFRGMIQDMHNPEFYFEQFEVYNTVTKEIKSKTGKYRDTANVTENEKINYTENFKGAQRQTMVVVSMPGLSDWAQNVEEKQNILKHLEQQPNSSKRLQSCTKLKRSYDEAEDDTNAMEVGETEPSKEMKTSETVNHTSSVLSREHLLNFPLPDMPSAVLNEAGTARDHLMKALTELLLGDQLAAEYLICHLIANVYLRQDTMTLGQFCLNISNLPTEKYPNYAKQLYDIIKQFVTKSYYLPLTIENMNTLALLPKKDYECNRLTSGILQLSNHTHLVLDETKMEQGTLDATGVGNITALGNMIQNQRVEYDFKYYKMDFDSDIPVLILSEGKSLLPSDYHLPLKPEDSSLEIFDAIVEAATYYLKEEIMNIIRVYLTSLKLVKYTMNEDLQFVEDDFIEMRSTSDSQNSVTADDLHRLLVLARLVSLSRGQNTLNKECWDITKSMESQRLQRLKNRRSAVL
ncbi:mini-chromosome maintenance complex-binding protein isoform X2 [Achroia grisella]|uniref:mini-chromosome maintenance complex-binding protein isoform X2 n=1 Tax=Achroia grisella TaxID=688607 RepID=UPI0027D34F74|nr:mini-chromosome maintenance complex-binding protein isoform X2 [Achroia grisella]